MDVEGRGEEYKGEIKNLKKMGRSSVRERLILHQSTFIHRSRTKERARNAGRGRGRKLTTNQNAVTLNSGQIVSSPFVGGKYRANDRQCFFFLRLTLFKETDAGDIFAREGKLKARRFKKVETIQFHRCANDRHCANNGGDAAPLLDDDKGIRGGERRTRSTKILIIMLMSRYIYIYIKLGRERHEWRYSSRGGRAEREREREKEREKE